VTSGINGLLPGGDYVAIPEAETFRCSGDHCRARVAFDGEQCGACRNQAEADRAAFAERDARESHMASDDYWREVRRA
jgi:hypothetical protein